MQEMAIAFSEGGFSMYILFFLAVPGYPLCITGIILAGAVRNYRPGLVVSIISMGFAGLMLLAGLYSGTVLGFVVSIIPAVLAVLAVVIAVKKRNKARLA